jgi:hypothetical protein
MPPYYTRRRLSVNKGEDDFAAPMNNSTRTVTYAENPAADCRVGGLLFLYSQV